jgi:hypothetical protein
MSLNRYWPIRDEINRCIKAEAEAASDAVLLAAHQTMTLVRRDEGSGIESQVGEHDLLEAFLSDDLPQGTLLMPITGPSGAGKSHLIRWLAAQLGREPRARQMHVIRIPKSASLRDVVELVLEPLSDDLRYAAVRKSLNDAIAQVTPSEAAIRFSAELEIALNRLTNRLMTALKSNPSADEARALKVRANHAMKLPGFLRDAALSDHMTHHVLAPIIQRAVSGRAELGPESDELLPQFRGNDLYIPDDLRSALGQAARPVQSYYQTGLNRADGAGYEEAAKVLNEVVDEAIQGVFKLDKATGGITLESIILRVRELLLEQGRELVLLVEDFAALSGIQHVLLSVCIQEAERDGSQVRSRMRTALALTDGYLVGRDTIATRAKHEWVIQPGTENGDVLTRTIELTGAYLNAARWGEKALKRQYDQGKHESEADLTTWITIFEDESDERLGAFGSSDSGVPLFPYNRQAIAELAKRHLRTAGQIRFNPRKVINFILRDILLDGRDAFERGDFPPAGFQDARVSAPIASWLAAQGIPDQERQRLQALLFYWGGNPGDPAQAQLPQGIFDAYGLKRPTGLAASSPATLLPPETPGPTPPTPQPQPPTEDPRVVQWREKLEAWTGGTELGQQDANKLRSVLRSNIEKAIPWNGMRLAVDRKINLALMIPNARGNPTAGIPIYVAKDHRDPDGELRHSLLAAIRIDMFNGRLDYPEADEDSARVAALVERLVTDIIPQIEQQRQREARVLAWILRKQGRLLGLFRRERLPAFDLELNALRAQTAGEDRAPLQQATEQSRWQQLRREAAGLRPELQQALWERIGCFQGAGNTVFAIDSTLIELPESADDLDPSFLSNNSREHLTQLKPHRLTVTTRPLIEKLRALTSRLDDLLGLERDKQGLLAGLAKLFDALEPVGVWPDGFNRNAMRREIETFRNFDLMAQLQEASPLLDEQAQIDAAADETLERLGRLNLSVIEQAGELLNRIEAFIAAVERAMEAKTGALEGIDPEADAKELERLLAQIDMDLLTIAGDISE